MQNASHRRDVTESGISYEPPMSLLPPGNCTREVNVNKPPQTDVKLRFPESTEIPDRASSIGQIFAKLFSAEI